MIDRGKHGIFAKRKTYMAGLRSDRRIDRSAKADEKLGRRAIAQIECELLADIADEQPQGSWI